MWVHLTAPDTKKWDSTATLRPLPLFSAFLSCQHIVHMRLTSSAVGWNNGDEALRRVCKKNIHIQRSFSEEENDPSTKPSCVFHIRFQGSRGREKLALRVDERESTAAGRLDQMLRSWIRLGLLNAHQTVPIWFPPDECLNIWIHLLGNAEELSHTSSCRGGNVGLYLQQ